MFYQKYRPQQFKDLIGNDSIVASITGAIKSGKFPHAFFFYGGRGSGKTTTARLVAKALNCESPLIKDSKQKTSIHLEPCGKCDSCRAIATGTHLDLIEIDAASNRGIDNIRELQDTIGLSPSLGRYKVYIIDEVHMLTKEASNALLKTLEEPPKHACFVLCTTNPEKVLPTIKSRCIQHRFVRPSVEDIVKKLSVIVKKEGLSITKDELKEIAIASNGAYRDAETILEQVASSGKHASFTLGDKSNISDFIKLISQKDIKGSISFISELQNSGIDISLWGNDLIIYLRQLLFKLLGMQVSEEIDDVNLSVSELKTLIKLFTDAKTNMIYASIPTLPFEMAVIEYCDDNSDSPASGGVSNNTAVDQSVNTKQKKTMPKSKQESEVESVGVTKKTKRSSRAIDEDANAVAKTVSGFPYKKLIEHLKPHNHSIYLIMSSCRLKNFDGEKLHILADFSFHKERLMSNKVRTIIEEVASKLVNRKVVLYCEVARKGKNLTDRNVVKPPTNVNLEEVFESVFGEDIL